MQTNYADMQGTLCRVSGKWTRYDGEGGLWRTQRFVSEWRDLLPPHGADGERIRFEARFDDSCRNGRNEFAITGETRVRGREASGGCIHESIVAAFPEVAGLIPWHLTSSAGPMHYVANAVFLAGDRDHNGLRAGEFRQFVTRDGLPRWKLAAFNPDGSPAKLPGAWDSGVAGHAPPEAVPVLRYVADGRTGEGKPRELDAARRVANWPEATDAELSAEPAELRRMLESRLPALLERFRREVTSAGMFWESV